MRKEPWNELSMQFYQLILLTLLIFCVPFIGNAQLPSPTNQRYQVDEIQIFEILDLIDQSKSEFKKKMKQNWAEESRSRLVMRAGYDFAEEFSQILHLEKVPFKLVTASATFMSCWTDHMYRKTDDCWSIKLEKVLDLPYQELKDKQQLVSKKDLKTFGSYAEYANSRLTNTTSATATTGRE